MEALKIREEACRPVHPTGSYGVTVLSGELQPPRKNTSRCLGSIFRYIPKAGRLKSSWMRRCSAAAAEPEEKPKEQDRTSE